MHKSDRKDHFENIDVPSPSDMLAASLEILPRETGVYIFRDERGKIIYIGKARNIYNRVKSYFSKRSRDFLYMKPSGFVRQIKTIDYIVTSNEVEALILEGTLIKKNRPRYNIDLKDDKSYPFIAITNERYPRVFLTRNKNTKEAKYFGPYTDVKAVKNTIEYLRSIFKIRDCRGVKPGKSTKPPCLNYHIKLCSAPCTGNISQSDYRKNIEHIRDFLKGRDRTIIDELKKNMASCCADTRFEEAAEIREKIKSIKILHENQRIIFDSMDTWDFIAIKREIETASISLFTYRAGALALVNNFIIENRGRLEGCQILSGFINQYYEDINSIPSKIYVPVSLEDSEIIEEWFSIEKGRKVRIKIPKTGGKKKIMEMVIRNAALYLKKKKFEKSTGHSQGYSGLLRLSNILGLENIPRKIECYDISNLGESFPVGSMTVATDSKIKPELYRHFKIRTVTGQDDCAMLREVINRRLKYLDKHGMNMEDSFYMRPDLIIIDGGKPQYGTIKKALEQKGVSDIDIISIAKKEEMIFCQKFQDGIKFDLDSDILRIIIKLRDEAHRFAIGYHRKLRGKYMTNSVLDQIKGIGERKKAYILESIDSIEEVKDKNIEDLINIKGINYNDAVNIYNSFHR